MPDIEEYLQYLTAWLRNVHAMSTQFIENGAEDGAEVARAKGIVYVVPTMRPRDEV